MTAELRARPASLPADTRQLVRDLIIAGAEVVILPDGTIRATPRGAGTAVDPFDLIDMKAKP